MILFQKMNQVCLIMSLYFAVKASSVRGKSGLTGGAAPGTTATRSLNLLLGLLLTSRLHLVLLK